MKPATSTLISFLENATSYVRADLYTFNLVGGAVLRYCSTSIPISFGGSTYNVGPPIQDAGVQSARGTGGASVDVTILSGDSDSGTLWTVNGVPILDFIEGLGLDGATATIQRVFAASWSDMVTTGPVGGYLRFGGYVREIKEHGQTQSVITLSSYMDMLAAPFPVEVYQVSCLNTFGDARCGVNVASLAVSGAVSSAATPGATGFDTNLTQADHYFDLGVVKFTSGGNNGLSRTVKSFLYSGGALMLSAPFPAAPAVGDAFSITPGCLLSTTACAGWQSAVPGGSPPSWQERFRGTPFVPPPNTGLPT